MRYEITTIDDVSDSMFIEVRGMWDRKMMEGIAEIIVEKKPTYLVFDPTHSIITPEQAQSVNEAHATRQTNIRRIAQLLVNNPKMIYVIVNRNDNPVLKTGIPVYEELSVADRYIFVKTTDEALDLVRSHYQSNTN